MSVTIVTNSLASTNHIPVHAGYSRYRKDMLKMGASIFEVRANAGENSTGDAASTPTNVTLHTKLILIDRRYLFVGSLNLDPRSIEINAEMGLLIDSKEIGQKLLQSIEKNLGELSYKVELSDRGKLTWRATIEGEEVVETREPLSTWWQRFLASVFRILPESQL